MLDYRTILTMISNIGFPIVLVGYLILRFEKIIAKNTESVNNLTYIVKELKIWVEAYVNSKTA